MALKIPADIEDALLHVFAPGPASGCATPGTISCVWGSDQNRSTGATLQDSTGPGFKAALDRCPRGTDGSNPLCSSEESGANLIFGAESHR